MARQTLLGACTFLLLISGVHADDPPYAIFDLHTDHLGNVRAVTNSAGEVVSLHDFYPFGEEIQGFYSPNTKRFTGHERDEETGLDYMLARYYSSSISRFTGVDPVGGNLFFLESWNRHSYANNNPIGVVDPDGRVDEYRTPAVRDQLISLYQQHGGGSSASQFEHGFVGMQNASGTIDAYYAPESGRHATSVELPEMALDGSGLEGHAQSQGSDFVMAAHAQPETSDLSGSDWRYWQRTNERAGHSIPDYGDFYAIGPNGVISRVLWVWDADLGRFVIRQDQPTTILALRDVALADWVRTYGFDKLIEWDLYHHELRDKKPWQKPTGPAPPVGNSR